MIPAQVPAPRSSGLGPGLPEPAYWNAKQLAAYVGRPVKTVYKWPGLFPDMPCAEVSRAKLFPIERVKKWLRDQEQGRRPSSKRMPSVVKSQVSGSENGHCAHVVLKGRHEVR